jgi:hypothetical protein
LLAYENDIELLLTMPCQPTYKLGEQI